MFGLMHLICKKYFIFNSYFAHDYYKTIVCPYCNHYLMMSLNSVKIDILSLNVQGLRNKKKERKFIND